jgi:hypothetical protein
MPPSRSDPAVRRACTLRFCRMLRLRWRLHILGVLHVPAGHIDKE